MLRKFATFCILIFFNSLLTGQYLFEIKYEYQLNYTLPNYGNTGESVLYFNKKCSYYKSNTVPSKDEFEVSGMSVNYTYGDEHGFPIYTDISGNKMFTKVSVDKKVYVLQEDISKRKIRIKDSIKTIHGYKAKLAIFQPANPYLPEFQVWYCPDLPFPFGPEFIQGLPGLVLEAKSLDDNYHFKIKELKESIVTESLFDFNNAKDNFIEKCDYLKIRKEARDVANLDAISNGEEPIDWKELDRQSNNLEMLNYEMDCPDY